MESYHLVQHLSLRANIGELQILGFDWLIGFDRYKRSIEVRSTVHFQARYYEK